MRDHIDPATGALWAIIAVALLVIGGTLTTSGDVLSAEQRGSVIAASVAVLGAVALWGRRKPPPPSSDDS